MQEHARYAIDMLDRAYGANAPGQEALVMATLGVGYALLHLADVAARLVDIADAAADDRMRTVVDDQLADDAGPVIDGVEISPRPDEPVPAFDRVDLVNLADLTHRTHHVQLPPDTPGAGATEWRDCPLPSCEKARDLFDTLPMRP